jgi:hypothetical protein
MRAHRALLAARSEYFGAALDFAGLGPAGSAAGGGGRVSASAAAAASPSSACAEAAETSSSSSCSPSSSPSSSSLPVLRSTLDARTLAGVLEFVYSGRVRAEAVLEEEVTETPPFSSSTFFPPPPLTPATTTKTKKIKEISPLAVDLLLEAADSHLVPGMKRAVSDAVVSVWEGGEGREKGEEGGEGEGEEEGRGASKGGGNDALSSSSSSPSPPSPPLRLLCELLVVSDARAAARLRSHCLGLVAARFDELTAAGATAAAGREKRATTTTNDDGDDDDDDDDQKGTTEKNGPASDETLVLAELVRYARPEFDAAGDLVAEHLAAARPRAKGIVVAAGLAAGEGVGTLAQDLRESYLEGKGKGASASSAQESSRDALAREFDAKLRDLLALSSSSGGGE